MSLDPLDAAFVRRLVVAPRRAVPPPATVPAAPRTAAPPRRVDAPPVCAPPPPAVPQPPPAASVAAGLPPTAGPTPDGHARANRFESDPVVERLIARAPGQWVALAGHVEAARQHGRRVIAVAGSRSREGRTTLVRCLAETLRARGRDVVCAAPHDLAAVADGSGPTHDKRIILVDAGIWFPPGPIRRAALQVASLGCDAAILVRRSGASGGLARQAALEALGIEVLGEVLTFAAPHEADADHHGDAAA